MVAVLMIQITGPVTAARAGREAPVPEPFTMSIAPGSGAGPIGPCGGRPGGYAGAIGSNGPAGVGSQTAGTHFFNTLLSSNAPSNCSGLVSDGGYNITADARVAFPASGSRTNINPMLGPLVNNGGPTLTMALLPGSPAI